MENKLSEISENDLKRVCAGRDVKVEYREDAYGRAGCDITVIGGNGSGWPVSSSRKTLAATVLHETQLTRLVNYFVGRAVREVAQGMAIQDKCAGAYSPRSRAGKAERWR